MSKHIINFLALFFYTVLNATIINVPLQHSTIEGALIASAEGDTIILAAGAYTQTDLLKINKSVTIASNFLFTNNEADINRTIINAATSEMHEWFEVAAKNAKVTGIKFIGNKNHTLNITAEYAYVTHCKFIGGKDQLSISGGGGNVGYCYFENAGDDGIDCDNSTDWIIEHNTIVNSHQDGIEIRLQDKDAPLTTHVFRYNKVVGAGESGIQIIDYQGNSNREFYVHNNIFQDCRGAGISCMYREMDNTTEVYRGSLMEEIVIVNNNTIIGCNYGLTISPGLLVLNTIFANLKTKGIERGLYVNDNNDRSMVDYCLFYNNPIHFDRDISIGENNVMDVDPLLDEQLFLTANSPCLDMGIANYEWKGKNLTLSPADYIGNKPDIGAFEFGSEKRRLNDSPVINAGNDIVLIYPENKMVFHGSVGGMDPQPAMNYSWTMVSGPGKVKFSTPTDLQSLASFSKQGAYELMLTGSGSEYTTSDKLSVHYVKDFMDRTVSVDRDNDAFFEAEDFRYIVGSAKVVPHPQGSNQVVESQDGIEAQMYTQYQISTKDTGTLYLWILFTGKEGRESKLVVSLNDLQKEWPIKAMGNNQSNNLAWQRITFSNVPEGIYPLRIRATQPGVSWDKVFVTYDASKKPPE